MSQSTTNKPAGGGYWQPPGAEFLTGLLDEYEIHRLIGVGGMAAVYKATQTRVGRTVAIKVMPAAAGAEYAYAERFEQEAKAMAKLTHPNVVAVYNFGLAGEYLYIVMEFVDGTDLHHLFHSNAFDPNKIPSYLVQICNALEYAHRHGIIHRDIKPANVIVAHDGTVKVADFGLATIQDPARGQMSTTGVAMGTPDYAAPEVLDVSIEADQRADIFSLGVLAYELIAGEIPRGSFEPPSRRNPDIDPRVDPVVEKAMRRDREQRHRTVAEFRGDLKRALAKPKRPKLLARRRKAGRSSRAHPEANRGEAQSAGATLAKWAFPLAGLVAIGFAFIFAFPGKPGPPPDPDTANLIGPPGPGIEPGKVEGKNGDPRDPDPGISRPGKTPNEEKEKPGVVLSNPNAPTKPVPATPEVGPGQPAIPSKPPGKPELPDPNIAGGKLSLLIDSYKDSLDSEVTSPHREATNRLTTFYLGGLKRADEAAVEATDPETVLALRTEAESISSGSPVPEMDAPGTHPKLAALRATYRTEWKKIVARRDAAAATARVRFLGELSALMADLTAEGKVADARSVRGFRDNLTSYELGEIPLASARLRQGRIRGYGVFYTNRKAKAVDIKAGFAAGFDDFVEVVASQNAWAARRKTGDVLGALLIGNKAVKIRASGIAKIFASTFNGGIFGIDRHGVLGKVTEHGFRPESWPGGDLKVTDFADAGYHSIALTGDGRAHIRGEIYRTGRIMGQNAEKFQRPPDGLLENVAFVAATRFRGCLISQQNELITWGEDGVSKLRLELDGKVARFISGAGFPLILSETGTVYAVDHTDGQRGGISSVADQGWGGPVTAIAANHFGPTLTRDASGKWDDLRDGEPSAQKLAFLDELKTKLGDAQGLALWTGTAGEFAVWIEAEDL